MKLTVIERVPRLLSSDGELTFDEVEHEEEAEPFGNGFALVLDEGETFASISLLARPGVTLEVGLINGQPACVGVRSDGTVPLTSTLLHKLPIRRLLAEHLRYSAVVRLIEQPDGTIVGEPTLTYRGPFLAPDALTEAAAKALRDGFTSRAPRDSMMEHEKVAAAYRLAIAEGRSTQKVVAEACGVAFSTARKKIMRARRAGALGLAPGKRQKGEQP